MVASSKRYEYTTEEFSGSFAVKNRNRSRHCVVTVFHHIFPILLTAQHFVHRNCLSSARQLRYVRRSAFSGVCSFCEDIKNKDSSRGSVPGPRWGSSPDPRYRLTLHALAMVPLGKTWIRPWRIVARGRASVLHILCALCTVFTYLQFLLWANYMCVFMYLVTVCYCMLSYYIDLIVYLRCVLNCFVCSAECFLCVTHITIVSK